MNIKPYITLKNYWLLIIVGVIILFLYFFNSTLESGLEWKQEKEDFVNACQTANGVVFDSKVSEGRSRLACVNKDIIISVEQVAPSKLALP